MRNLSQKLPSRNSGSRFDGHIALFRKKYTRKGEEAGITPFPALRSAVALYLPSLSGKASLSGSSTASRLPLFPTLQFHRNRCRSEYPCDSGQYAAYKCPFTTHGYSPFQLCNCRRRELSRLLQPTILPVNRPSFL